MTPDPDCEDRPPAAWRTPTAIGIATSTGLPIGVFLGASAAAPFGQSIALGWLVALAGAVILTAGLCLLATGRYVTVGVGYAAGVAMGNGFQASLSEGVSGLLVACPVFPFVAVASMLGSLPCTLVKWEHQKAREKDRQRLR